MHVNDSGTLKKVLMVIVNDHGVLRRVNRALVNNAGEIAGGAGVYDAIHATTRLTASGSSWTTTYDSVWMTSKLTSGSVSYTTNWNSSYTTSWTSTRTTSVGSPVSRTTSWWTQWTTYYNGNAEWQLTGKTTSATTTYTSYRNTTVSVPMSRTTSVAKSKLTTRGTSWVTRWQTSVPVSKTTSVGSGGAGIPVTAHMRITADGAGGYRYTEVPSADSYGHSYVENSAWVETT